MSAWIRPLFVLAGIYDGGLGVAFLFFHAAIFAHFGVTPPNHAAYVQFPALLLILFAALFFQVAADPAANRKLIPYGVGLKAAYCGTTFWYAAAAGIPSMWMPWAWADLGFLIVFAVAWVRLGAAAGAKRAE
ncbi:MAG: hypothetical protein HYY18_20130 [Planctomycetes bacterium]|nr:hypothetical protein [Planctomycetota bacterium]